MIRSNGDSTSKSGPHGTGPLRAKRHYLWILVAIAVVALIGPNVGAADPLTESPLAHWRGFGHSPAEDDEAFLEEFTRREALKTACMAKQGLHYSPRTAVVTERVSGETAGVATLEIVDLNAAIVETFDRADYKQYSRALLGLDDLADPFGEVADTNGDGEVDYLEAFGGGCAGAAHRAIPGVYAAKAILTHELIEMERTARTDSRSVDAERRWTECMARRGFEGSRRVDLLNRLEGSDDGVMDLLTTALEACDPPYRAVVAEVVIELETQFVKDHQHVLDEFGIRR
jgi:hypothetical protein